MTFPSLPSTNTWAIENISSLSHGDVVMTNEQTAGRGRFNRPWISGQNKCLTFSLVLKNSILPDPALIPPCIASAVRAALVSLGMEVKLKWPNDVMVNNRKIAGILCETTDATNLIVAGTGINININSEDFERTGLAGIATSLLIETGNKYDTDNLLSNVLKKVEKTADSTAENISGLLKEWRKNDWLIQRDITVKTAKGSISGKYEGIDNSFHLILKDGNEQTQTFASGDVSVTSDQ